MLSTIAQARALYDQERYDEALRLLEPVVQSDPESAEAWTLLSNTLDSLWRSEEALPAAERAVALHPQDAAALCAKAGALSGVKRYQEALHTIELALSLAPQSIPALRRKAGILALTGQPQAALARFDAILAGGTMDFRTLESKIALLTELGRYREAILIAQSLVEMRPNSVAARVLFAASLSGAGEQSHAMNEVKRARGMNRKDFRVYVAQGAEYLARGKYQEAFRAYGYAVAVNPKSQELRRQYATAQRFARPAWLNALVDLFQSRRT